MEAVYSGAAKGCCFHSLSVQVGKVALQLEYTKEFTLVLLINEGPYAQIHAL